MDLRGVVVCIWGLLGLISFVMSLVCFGGSYTGTTSEKVIGVVVAALFGPLYWIYFWMSKTSPTAQGHGLLFCKKIALKKVSHS